MTHADRPQTESMPVAAPISDEQKRIITACMMVLATVAIAGVLIFTRSVMVPFVISIFIVSIVSPIVDYQVIRWKFPRSIAVTSALLVVLAFVSVFSLFVFGAIQGVANTANEYSEYFLNFGEKVGGAGADIGPIAEYLNIEKGKLTSIINGISRDIAKAIPTIATRTAGTAVDVLTSGFFIVIFVIFLLAGRNPHEIRKGIYAEVDQKIRSYIAAKVALSATTGILVWVILAFYGLKFAGIFGLLAFMLNFIPSIGSVIATLLPIPIAVVQYHLPDGGWDVWPLVGVILFPGAVQMIIGNVVEPKVMGKGLELHPVTVVLTLAFWGLLWGAIGAVLAVPITAVLRIVLMRFDAGKPIGRLLAGQLPGSEKSVAA